MNYVEPVEHLGQYVPAGYMDPETELAMRREAADEPGALENIFASIPELPEGSAPWIVGGVALVGAIAVGMWWRAKRRRRR